ncbi:hypothetical protein ANO11243_081120 [Dothideomycetidae sp. 11243]|nr:hypothetical protein ANO11243_081120 [fungal sp. No.11243]
MAPQQRLAQVASHLSYGGKGEKFEDIPVVPRVAADGPRVKDKVVIITGANSALGIGRAAAHRFAQNGAQAIYICDFSTSNLETHVRELKSLYPSVAVHARQMDAASESDVSRIVAEALSTYSRLDVFFANAGITRMPSRIWEATAEDFNEVMRVNALSVFLATKHASLAMQKTSPSKTRGGGSIVATASTAGLRSNAGPTDYSASKAAVVSIMQTACYQLSGTNVRCNAICPGIVETGMTGPVYEMARARGTEKKIGQLNPLQRGAVADEIARVALFLGSDESSYVNGQAWAVDGGLSAGHPYVLGKMN